MAEISAVEAWCNELIARLEPAARRTLAREIAKTLRVSQQKRIAAQQNPDGSAFAPRKPQLKDKKGRIKRQMFSKLRTAKYLKADSSPDAAIVRFTHAVDRIAQVHQFGLRDRVNRKTGLEAKYPARELLGLTDADQASIREIVTAHLAR